MKVICGSCRSQFFKSSRGICLPFRLFVCHLAVKMLFNYEAESNSFAIMNAMQKETVPAKRILLSDDDDTQLEDDKMADGNRLPPHANIVDVKVAFADHIPHIVDAVNHYPDALPRRLGR